MPAYKYFKGDSYMEYDYKLIVIKDFSDDRKDVYTEEFDIYDLSFRKSKYHDYKCKKMSTFIHWKSKDGVKKVSETEAKEFIDKYNNFET